jgi:DNA-binding response OmpR family regulator
MGYGEEKIMKGKRILAADDELDVLEILEELLFMCKLVKASTFEEAKKQLETQTFDFAILDIMGINGYKLLEIALQKNVTALILTAHALSPEETVKAFKAGAASYVPKDEIARITTFLTDIMEAQRRGKGLWWRWMSRLGSFYDVRFGKDWKERDKEFWTKLDFFDG